MIKLMNFSHTRSIPSLCIGCIRELVLILCAGFLLGNLFAFFNGGLPQAQAASTASIGSEYSSLRASEIHYTMDPSDPSHLKEIQFGVQTTDGSQPEVLWIKLSGSSDRSLPCRSNPGGHFWTCVAEDVHIAEMSALEVFVP